MNYEKKYAKGIRIQIDDEHDRNPISKIMSHSRGYEKLGKDGRFQEKQEARPLLFSAFGWCFCSFATFLILFTLYLLLFLLYQTMTKDVTVQETFHIPGIN